MSDQRLLIHPDAVDEAEAALAWYANRSDAAAQAFLDELDRTISKIALDPNHYQLHEFDTRRAVLRRFPYVVVFRIDTGGIEIIALMHGHRRPGYWRARL